MTTAPPKISSAKISSPNALFAVIVLGLAGAGLAAVVYFFNPASNGFYPVCRFHQLTGLNCPGCGSTRALYALLHGHLLAALRDNALLVAGLAAAVARGAWLGWCRLRGRNLPAFFPPRWLWPLLVVVALFGILRNLPAFSFLSP
jgi:hypothetical protein